MIFNSSYFNQQGKVVALIISAFLCLQFCQPAQAQIYFGIDWAVSGAFSEGFSNKDVKREFHLSPTLLNPGVYSVARIRNHSLKMALRTGSFNGSYSIQYHTNSNLYSRISFSTRFNQFGLGYGYAIKNWFFQGSASVFQSWYGGYGISSSLRGNSSVNEFKFEVSELSGKRRWNLLPSLEIGCTPFQKKIPNLSFSAEFFFLPIATEPASFRTIVNDVPYDAQINPSLWLSCFRMAYTFSMATGRQLPIFKTTENR
jgi:hypothetical protein